MLSNIARPADLFLKIIKHPSFTTKQEEIGLSEYMSTNVEKSAESFLWIMSFFKSLFGFEKVYLDTLNQIFLFFIETLGKWNEIIVDTGFSWSIWNFGSLWSFWDDMSSHVPYLLRGPLIPNCQIWRILLDIFNVKNQLLHCTVVLCFIEILICLYTLHFSSSHFHWIYISLF